MTETPQEAHIRDLEMFLREGGSASTTSLDGQTRRNWVRKDLKRKLGRHIGMEVDGEGRTTYTCIPDKERN